MAAFLGLLASIVVGLTFLNYGLYRLDPSSFIYPDSPSLFSVARYSFSSLYGSEIAALQAQSEFANALALASMFLGIGILGTFVLTLFNSRRERQTAAAEATISRIKRHGAKLDRRLEDNYEMDVPSALARLEELQGFFVRWIVSLSDRIPDDFDDSFRSAEPRATASDESGSES